MRRLGNASIAAVLLLAFATIPVAAASGCPSAASGFRAGAVNWDWEFGEPIPAGDLLWEVTVLAGLEAEGLTIDDALEMLGIGTVEEFYGFAVEGWRGLDKNADGTICFKPFPAHQQGQAAYFSNFIDNNARE